jgi:hypothetical protein
MFYNLLFADEEWLSDINNTTMVFLSAAAAHVESNDP